MWLDAARGIVPQPPRAAELFRRARPLEADVFEGMLVCEVEVDGDRWDGTDPLGAVRRTLGRPEIDAEITLPGRDDRLRYRGPDDQNRVHVALPGVRLVRDDSIGIGLVDRDVLANDPIGAFVLTYAGTLPLSATIESASIECRAVARNLLDARITETLGAADAAMASLERGGRLNRQLVGFRPPEADPYDAWVALYEFATFVGLADPRFLERRDRLRAREVAHVDAVRQLVRSLLDGSPPLDRFVRIDGTRLALRVDEYDCKLGHMLLFHPEVGLDVPMECALRVTVRNEGDSDATLNATQHAVDDLGATEVLPRAALLQGDLVERMRTLRFPPGDSAILLPTPSRHAVLLRVGLRRSVIWVRIPAAVLDEDAIPRVRSEPARAP